MDFAADHPRNRAVFTTYALSLSFFEDVVLDALIRGGARERLILADIDGGVRGSLSELGGVTEWSVSSGRLASVADESAP